MSADDPGELLDLLGSRLDELSSLELEELRCSIGRSFAMRAITEYELATCRTAEIVDDDLIVRRNDGSKFRALGAGMALIDNLIAEAEHALERELRG